MRILKTEYIDMYITNEVFIHKIQMVVESNKKEVGVEVIVAVNEENKNIKRMSFQVKKSDVEFSLLEVQLLNERILSYIEIIDL